MSTFNVDRALSYDTINKIIIKEIRLKYIYRLHVIERMFQRNISEEQVEETVSDGEIIETYLDDKPYPSYLVLGYSQDMVIHVVYAMDEDGNIIIITIYRPSLKKWKNDFKTRKG